MSITLENSLAVSDEVNISLTYDPAISFLGVHSKEMKTSVCKGSYI